MTATWLMQPCGDNNVSSIKVKKIVCNPGPDGVTLYSEKDFKGYCETFKADDPDLNGNTIANNRASSLTVVGASRVCLYRSQNYAEGSLASIRTITISPTILSVTITPHRSESLGVTT